MTSAPQYVLRRFDGRFLSRSDGWGNLASAKLFSPVAAVAVLNALDQIEPDCVPVRVTVKNGVPALIARPLRRAFAA